MSDTLEINGVVDDTTKILNGSLTQNSLSLNATLETEGTVIGNIGLSTLRGESIVYKWNGTYLGIKLESQDEYEYVDLSGVDGIGIQSVEIQNRTLIVHFTDGTSLDAGTLTETPYDDTLLKQDIKNVQTKLDELKPISNMKIASILQL